MKWNMVKLSNMKVEMGTEWNGDEIVSILEEN